MTWVEPACKRRARREVNMQSGIHGFVPESREQDGRSRTRSEGRNSNRDPFGLEHLRHTGLRQGPGAYRLNYRSLPVLRAHGAGVLEVHERRLSGVDMAPHALHLCERRAVHEIPQPPAACEAREPLWSLLRDALLSWQDRGGGQKINRNFSREHP